MTIQVKKYTIYSQWRGFWYPGPTKNLPPLPNCVIVFWLSNNHLMFISNFLHPNPSLVTCGGFRLLPTLPKNHIYFTRLCYDFHYNILIYRYISDYILDWKLSPLYDVTEFQTDIKIAWFLLVVFFF